MHLSNIIDARRIRGLQRASEDQLESALAQIVGDARVVGLGEGAHFVREYWAWREQAVRVLHQRLGFTVMAMEFGVGEGLALAGWLGGEGAVDDLASISPAAAGWGAADTMRFIRSHNSDAIGRGEQPLTFAGIDLPAAGGSFHPALVPLAGYAEAVNPVLASMVARIQSVTDRVDDGSGIAAASAWADLDPSARDEVLAGLARMGLWLRALQPHLRDHSAPVPHDTALLLAQSALVTAHLLQSRVERPGEHLESSVRERFLADAVLSLTENSAARIVVLAHNNHVQKSAVVFDGEISSIPMGMYLAQRLGADYRVVAQTTTDDHVPDMVLDAASPVGFRVHNRELPPPPADSLEATLNASGAGQSISLVDVRVGTGMPIVNRIRSQSGYVESAPGDAFDAVVNHPRITGQTDLAF